MKSSIDRLMDWLIDCTADGSMDRLLNLSNSRLWDIPEIIPRKQMNKPNLNLASEDPLSISYPVKLLGNMSAYFYSQNYEPSFSHS